MQNRFADVGCVRGTDDDVAELARPGRRATLVHAERQHVGCLIEASVLTVELADSILGDELDREVTVVDFR